MSMNSSELPPLGYCCLTPRTIIEIHGTDRCSFLHNFCTNDIKKLDPGSTCEVFITSVQGRCLGYGTVTAMPDSLILLTAAGQSQPLIDHFEHYVITEDVSFRNLSDRFIFLLTDIEIDVAEVSAATDELFFIPNNWFATPSNWLVSQHAHPEILEGVDLLNSDVAHTARIIQGIPEYGIDVSTDNFPQEMQRDESAISFTKGCYLGQEPIARIDALGHVNWYLVTVKLDTTEAIQQGETLQHSGEVVAKIRSIQSDTETNPLALALVRRETAPSETVIQTDCGTLTVV